MISLKRKIGMSASALSLSMLFACGGGGAETPAGDSGVVAGTSANIGAAAAAPVNAVAADSPALSCGLNQPAGIEAEMLTRLNKLRSENTVCGGNLYVPAGSLTWNSELLRAAANHSADMAENNYFSHTSNDGRTPPQRLVATGYNYSSMGENIAAGQSSVEAVVNAWLLSAEHCKNLMNPVFRDVAVACVANPGSAYVRYWSMELGREF